MLVCASDITIRFEHPTYTFIEGVSSAEVCLIKDLMTSRNITISDISTSDITTYGECVSFFWAKVKFDDQIS